MEREIQLPSWFKLSDYNFCQNFGIIEWYFNIRLRAHMLLPLQCINIFKNSYQIKATNDALNDIRNNWESFLEQRKILLTKDGLTECFQYNKKQLNEDCTKGIYPLTSHEIRAFYRRELENHEPNSLIVDVIRIDLHQSENQLISEFTRYIRDTKNQMLSDSTKIKSKKNYLGVVKNNFTDSDFHRWKSNAILAYMDLMVWVNYADVKISDTVLSEALQIDINKTRTSLKRIFKRMMTMDYIKAIYSQACLESKNL